MPTASNTPRLAPLEPPYEPEVAEMLAKWMPPASEAEPLALFRTLTRNAELSGRMRPLGAGILGPKARVAPGLREIVIHRTCALTGNEYEWGVHAIGFGRALGLDDERLRSTVHGSFEDACWEPQEACVFRLADELHHTSAISDELWDTLAAHFDHEQIIELVVTAGWYHVIAYLCNGLRIEHEPWAEEFPAPAGD